MKRTPTPLGPSPTDRERLLFAADSAGMTQIELARRLGVTFGSVARWRAGKSPSRGTMAIAEKVPELRPYLTVAGLGTAEEFIAEVRALFPDAMMRPHLASVCAFDGHMAWTRGACVLRHASGWAIGLFGVDAEGSVAEMYDDLGKAAAAALVRTLTRYQPDGVVECAA